MSESAKREFRGSWFGGFKRRDVLEYLERTAAAHEGELSALREENRSLQKELSDMGSALSGAEETVSALREELHLAEELAKSESGRIMRLQSDIEALNAAAGEHRADLSRLEEQLEHAKKEAEALSAEREALLDRNNALMGQIAQLEDSKRRVAEIEMAAHERARAIELEAQRRADALCASLEDILDRARLRYDTVRLDASHTMTAAADTLSRLSEELLELCAGLSAESEAIDGLHASALMAQGDVPPPRSPDEETE